MARVAEGATLPVLRVTGGHEALGTAVGTAMRPHIQRAVHTALEGLAREGLDAAALRERIAPALDAAERWTPGSLTELRAWARAADVPLEVLSYLSSAGLPPVSAAHGCTSVAVRGAHGGILVGHNEDSLVPVVDEVFLLDAMVAGSRFLSLCYVYALPGCSASLNGHGLAVLMDYLPDPDARPGLPMDFVTRALLDVPSIDAALDFLAATPRGGSGNCVLVQGGRVVNVELTSTRMVVTDASREGAWVHTNHFLDPVLATAAGTPQADSLPRLASGKRLVQPGLALDGVQRILADRQGFPDSICRERTLAGFVADPTSGEVRVCWGEPAHGTWTSHWLTGRTAP
ncbi:C45 family autoproteolytic acyltransferase/hydolase [Pyxidicoccus xibeiensis]|uniref:C45 family autoproteolytic acyltransferase/hydolase n=1 Tax=Pyxidicoccus xibeiensis TaxID=2906759 RepID=UPI0020A81B4A|nr:C45 family peptidase [Pyxidicoccus xibeiensis]MCP3136178.1 C45 family peptidase [Pyxidicoccus xibeiensis]